MKRFLFLMHNPPPKKKTKKTPAKKISVEKNAEHMTTLIWKTQRGEAAIRGVQKFRKIHRKMPVFVSILIKLQVSGSNFIKRETPTQVFFYEFCEKKLRMFIFHLVPPDDCLGILEVKTVWLSFGENRMKITFWI